MIEVNGRCYGRPVLQTLAFQRELLRRIDMYGERLKREKELQRMEESEAFMTQLGVSVISSKFGLGGKTYGPEEGTKWVREADGRWYSRGIGELTGLTSTLLNSEEAVAADVQLGLLTLALYAPAVAEAAREGKSLEGEYGDDEEQPAKVNFGDLGDLIEQVARSENWGTFDFGRALAIMREGGLVTRRNWQARARMGLEGDKFLLFLGNSNPVPCDPDPADMLAYDWEEYKGSADDETDEESSETFSFAEAMRRVTEEGAKVRCVLWDEDWIEEEGTPLYVYLPSGSSSIASEYTEGSHVKADLSWTPLSDEMTALWGVYQEPESQDEEFAAQRRFREAQREMREVFDDDPDVRERLKSRIVEYIRSVLEAGPGQLRTSCPEHLAIMACEIVDELTEVEDE